MPMSDYMRDVRSKVGHTLLEIPSVSVLVFDDAGRVLLVEHADACAWTTPGGALEPGEVPADAAVREMWEETGLHVSLSRVLGIYGGPEFTTSYANGDRVSFAMIVFEGRRIGGRPRPDGSETLAVGWFGQEDVARLEVQPRVPAVLERAFADREHLHFAPATWLPPDAG